MFRLAGVWQFVFRKPRAERCSALSWMLLEDPSLVRRSRISWICRSCIRQKQAEHHCKALCIRFKKKRKEKETKSYWSKGSWFAIPTSRSQPQPFVCGGSLHPLGCVHVSVWPPELPSLSLFWWVLLDMTPILAGSSATCDDSHQSFEPSEWSLGNRIQNSNNVAASCRGTLGIYLYW